MELPLTLFWLLSFMSKTSSEWERGQTNSELSGIVSVQNAYLNKGHICSGVILTHYFVISAASCYVYLSSHVILHFLFIVIDKNIFPSKGSKKQIRHIDRLILHPMYDNKYQNDVALIYVNKKIVFDDAFTRALPIVKEKLTLTENDCTTAGWLSELDSKTHLKNYSDLLTANVILVDKNWCSSSAYEYSDHEYCVASSEDKQHCFIHGGSPLICDGGLAAIRPSNQRICINKTRGAFFVPVAPNFRWIQAVVTFKRRGRSRRRTNKSINNTIPWRSNLIIMGLVFDKLLLYILDSIV